MIAGPGKVLGKGEDGRGPNSSAVGINGYSLGRNVAGDKEEGLFISALQ